VLETRFHRLGKSVFAFGGRGVYILPHWKLAVRLISSDLADCPLGALRIA
jgi:hypothetical protein